MKTFGNNKLEKESKIYSFDFVPYLASLFKNLRGFRNFRDLALIDCSQLNSQSISHYRFSIKLFFKVN